MGVAHHLCYPRQTRDHTQISANHPLSIKRRGLQRQFHSVVWSTTLICKDFPSLEADCSPISHRLHGTANANLTQSKPPTSICRPPAANHGIQSIISFMFNMPATDNEHGKMILKYGGLLLASSAASATRLPRLSAHQDVPIGKSVNGTYSGKHVPAYNQDAFLGIPYAQPPLGDLRFRRPVSLNSSWDGTRDAKEFGYSCYQSGNRTDMSEDCLTLNGKVAHKTISQLNPATRLM